ncbi:C-type lectin domain family 10 member A-like isoform X2 [Rana temporaria]|uniref:C-type lectin domain family 10 member A-like isoform X2 n=1 Tax=Rana temporaria TaxID=8407 RepID=UPI001AAC735D|nr:C-type lectin domain family 10 member A-like isoform X2 [Rana temporaria]
MSKREDLETESDEMMKNETNDDGTPPPKNTQYWVVLILVIIIMFMFLILVFFTILQFIHFGNLSSLLQDLKGTINNFVLRQEDVTSRQKSLSSEQRGFSSQLSDILSTLSSKETKSYILSRNLRKLELGTRPLSNDTQRVSGAVGKLEDEIWKAHGPSTPLCETHWAHYGLSCYYKSWKEESWEDARKECKSNMSDLVVVNGDDEMNFLYHFSEKNATWIGLAENHGTWEWVDDTSYVTTPRQWLYGMTYTSPASDLEGKGDCAVLVKRDSWSQESCSHQFTYICEKKRILL